MTILMMANQHLALGSRSRRSPAQPPSTDEFNQEPLNDEFDQEPLEEYPAPGKGAARAKGEDMALDDCAFVSSPAGEAHRPRRTSALAALGLRIMFLDARYRQRCRLAELSDEALRDIGKSRREAEAEAGKAIWSD